MFDFIAPTQFLLENPPIEHSHDCKKCLVKFSTVGELRRHRRYKHQDEKRHKCDQCEYKCVEFDKLIRHKRMHAGIKPFKCSQCQYESYDKSKIKRHFITHTREKPFYCELCGSRFTQSGSLKTHLSNVHSIKKVEFSCPFCTLLVSSNMGELRNHIRMKHKSSCNPVLLRNQETPVNIDETCSIILSSLTQTNDLATYWANHNFS